MKTSLRTWYSVFFCLFFNIIITNIFCQKIQLVGSYDTPGNATNIYVSNLLEELNYGNGKYKGGKMAFIADGSKGLQIIDVYNPSHPTLISCDSTITQANDIVRYSAFRELFVANGDSGINIIDIINPSNLVTKSIFYTDSYAKKISIAPYTYNLFVVQDYKIQIIDSNSTVLGTYNAPPYSTINDVFCNKNDENKKLLYVITNSTFDTTGSLQIINVEDSSKPTLLGYCDLPNNPKGIYVSGNFAYIANGNNGLQIVDISNLTDPKLISSYNLANNAIDIYCSDDLAYIAEGESGIQVVNVKDPYTPNISASFDTAGYAQGVCVSDGLIYVADGPDGIYILKYTSTIDHIGIEGPTEDYENNIEFYSLIAYYSNGEKEDITDAAVWNINTNYAQFYGPGYLIINSVFTDQSCNITATYQGNTYSYNLTIKNIPVERLGQFGGVYQPVCSNGNYAYIGEGFLVVVMDMSNPSNPKILSKISLPGFAEDLFVTGNILYVADSDYGLQIIDIKNPEKPILCGCYSKNSNSNYSSANTIFVTDNKAYIGYSKTGDYGIFKIIDVSNPYQPTLISSYDTGCTITDIYVTGSFAHVLEYEFGLEIFDISDPTNPTPIDLSYSGITHPLKIEISGHIAYIISDSSPDFSVLDITDPSKPTNINYTNDLSLLYPYDMEIVNNTLYIADMEHGLSIIDIANPEQPVLLGQWENPVEAYDISVIGNTAIVTCYDDGLYMVDITNPSQPFTLNFLQTLCYATDICISGNFVYTIDLQNMLLILDISNPLQPIQIGSCNISGVPLKICVSNNIGYISTQKEGLKIVDVSDPSKPTIVGTYPILAENIYVIDNIVYAVEDFSGLYILDVKKPSQPTLLGSCGVYDYHLSICISGSYAYIPAFASYGTFNKSGIYIIDISNPYQPVKIGYYPDNYCYDVKIVGDIAYVANSYWGLLMLDISNPSQPALIKTIDIGYPVSNINIIGNIAYVSNNPYGSFSIIDISNPYYPNLLYEYNLFHNYHGIQNMDVSGNTICANTEDGGLWILKYLQTTESANYTFDTDKDNWTTGSFEQLFSSPLYTNSYGSLIIQSRGNNTFGYWHSPLDAVEYTTNSLYRATFTIRGSATQEEAPSFRYHLDTQSATTFSVGIVESWMGGIESPDSNPKNYTVYFDPMNQSTYQDNELTDDLFVGFDMLNFNKDDNPYGAYYIDEVSVERFDKSEITTSTTVKIYDTSADFSNWVFGSYSDYFKPTLQITGDGFVGHTADNDNTNTYGFWESSRSANEVDIEQNKLYRARFTVFSHSEQSNCPQLRLRIGTESNKMCSAYVVNSNLDGINSPNTLGKTYDVYMYPPQSDVNNPSIANGLIFAMDMLNFDGIDDANGDLILDKVEVQAFDTNMMP